MSEGQQFFLIFVLLYLSESVLWVKPDAWVFTSGWWGRWKASEPQPSAGRGRFVFAQPLPPLGWGFVCGPGTAGAAGVERARNRVVEFHAATSSLHRLAQWLLFPWLFAIVPGSYRLVGPSLPFWLILGAGWAIMVASAAVFARAHRRLFPTGRGEERLAHTLLAALVPQHTLRATGVLARRWLEDCHPLAVAAVVLEAAEFRTLAARAWRESSFPRPGADPASAEATRASVAAILGEAGLDPATLIEAPARTGDAAAYCPRCHVLFQETPATCPDCGGLPVVPF